MKTHSSSSSYWLPKRKKKRVPRGHNILISPPDARVHVQRTSASACTDIYSLFPSPSSSSFIFIFFFFFLLFLFSIPPCLLSVLSHSSTQKTVSNLYITLSHSLIHTDPRSNLTLAKVSPLKIKSSIIACARFK